MAIEPSLRKIFLGQKDEDTGITHILYSMDYPDWDDFGQPEVMTITVEPGDKLNNEDSV